jgi:flagellar secretion chaperone FliS
VSGFARNAKLAAYHSVAVHGGVASADRHGLVQMLMDGAVERMSTALGCLERGEIARKSALLHSAITLIAELRGSLNMSEGGALAQNLSNLYEYMTRRLLLANASGNPKPISEVLDLLNEIRGAWTAIGPSVRQNVPAVPGTR